MQRYASYSKILEDTRVRKREAVATLVTDRRGVPSFLNTNHQGTRTKRTTGRIRMWFWSSNVAWKLDLGILPPGGVYSQEIFFKKCVKRFKISSFCPLNIATKGDTMINNMVLSREIEWIGYEHKRNMLQVEFIVGSIYQYENVPETVYQEFLTAPSYGRYFESNIKNKYHVRKVR